MWLHEWIAEKQNISIEDAKLETLKTGLGYVKNTDYFAIFPLTGCNTLEFKNGKHYGSGIRFFGYLDDQITGIQIITAYKCYEKNNYYHLNFKKDMLNMKGENSKILIKYPNKTSVFLLSNEKEENLGEWNLDKIDEMCHHIIKVDKNFKLDFHHEGSRTMAYVSMIRKRNAEKENFK